MTGLAAHDLRGSHPATIVLAMPLVLACALACTQRFTTGVALAVAALPCLIFAARRPPPRLASAGSVLVLSYAIFFLVRPLTAILADHPNTLVLLPAGRAHVAHAQVLLGVGGAMLALVLGLGSATATRLTRRLPGLEAPRTAADRAFWLGLGLLGLAYLGLALLVVELGGIGGLIERYAAHSKLFVAPAREKLGLMLWSMFHAPAIWLLALAWASGGSRRFVRLAALGAALAGGVAIALLIFGSRTQLLALLVGLVLAWDRHRWRVSGRAVAAAAVPMALLSLWVVSYRTGGPAVGRLDGAEVSAHVGHGVYDVLVAIHEDPLPREFYTDPARWAQIPIALVPRVVWPDKPIIQDTRIDWLIARHYRSDADLTSTGYPGSIFSEWYVIGGWLLAAVAGFAFGAAVGAIDAWAERHRRALPVTLLYATLVVIAFSYFKDGDVVMAIYGGAKMLALTAALLLLLGARRAVPLPR
jgi:hypothetical protein